MEHRSWIRWFLWGAPAEEILILRIFHILLICAGVLWAEAFDHAKVQMEGGAVQPLFSLSHHFGPTPQGRGMVQFEYAENLSSRVGFAYAKLKGWEVSDIHFAQGDVGLDWQIPHARSLQVGGGISLFFVRADPTPAQEEAVFAYQLYDNESEFGWHARIAFTVWQSQRFSCHVASMYHQVWSRPQATHFVWIGLGGGFALW